MPYSIKVDGQFHDVIFRRISTGLYHANLNGSFLGSFRKLRSGWAVVSVINVEGTLRHVEGFKTRWKALEYLIESSPLADNFN